MKKSDVIIALVVGELIALLSFGILENLGLETRLLYWLWPLLLPFLSLFALWAAFLVGKKILLIWQAAKFALVGVLNTVLDLGVLNLLILLSGIASGVFYSVFKGISFTIAVVNSYFWNKFWTFKKKEGNPEKEFLQFLVVSLIGFGINVGVASMIVNLVGPQFSLSSKIWANVGAITATLCAMTWNFLGYKFIVFK